MPIKKRGLLRYCPACNVELDAVNFYTSQNPHHNGYLPFCKKHCEEFYQSYLSQTGSTSTALWYTCAEVGIPFVTSVYKQVEQKKNEKIQAYKEEVNPATGKKRTDKQVKDYIDNYKVFAFYIDTLRKTNCGLNDWSTFLSGTDTDFKDINNNVKSFDVIESEKAQYILDWGQQDNLEDYQFLDACFSKYTKGVEFVNAQQEDLYRDLCRDRLLLRKITDGRYNGSETLDGVQKRIDRLMSTLKVNEFESNRPKTLSEQLIFNKISQIEETKPADFYKDYNKYRDISKIRHYMKDMVLRPLKNCLVGSRDFNVDIDNIEQYDLNDEAG